MKRLQPFFSYFGSKHRTIRRYDAPLYPLIVESFAGSAAYACAYYWLDILLVEENATVAGVWDFLIRASSSEVSRLPLLAPGQRIQELTAIPEEAKALIGFWSAKGQSRPANMASAWGRRPKYASQFWGEEIRGRVARQVDLIKHWKIVNASYKDAPDVLATHFVDPPYQGAAGSHYPNGSRRIDYAHLGEWCRSRRGQVIVCENEGAEWLPFQPFLRAKANHGGGRKGVSHEAVWTQGSHALQASLF